MRIRYDILASATLSHTYFTDNKFEDFEIIPVTKTQTLMNQFGLLQVKQGGKWFLLYRSMGPKATPFESFLNKEAQFMLKITNPDFYNITQSGYLPVQRKKTAFIVSRIDNTALPAMRDVHEMKFSYEIKSNARPVSVLHKKFSGDILLNKTVVDPQERTINIDVTPTGEYAYDINEQVLPDSSSPEIYYASEIYFSTPFYGIIYFKIVPVSDTNSNHYEIKFEKK
jgi:hypothetical protein